MTGKPPLEVDDETLERWSREAHEWARKVKQGVNNTMIGVPPHGDCKSCDRDEEHEHKFRLSK